MVSAYRTPSTLGTHYQMATVVTVHNHRVYHYTYMHIRMYVDIITIHIRKYTMHTQYTYIHTYIRFVYIYKCMQHLTRSYINAHKVSDYTDNTYVRTYVYMYDILGCFLKFGKNTSTYIIHVRH